MKEAIGLCEKSFIMPLSIFLARGNSKGWDRCLHCLKPPGSGVQGHVTYFLAFELHGPLLRHSHEPGPDHPVSIWVLQLKIIQFDRGCQGRHLPIIRFGRENGRRYEGYQHNTGISKSHNFNTRERARGTSRRSIGLAKYRREQHSCHRIEANWSRQPIIVTTP